MRSKFARQRWYTHDPVECAGVEPAAWPPTISASERCSSHFKTQLLRRTVKQFRGGLVLKVHRLCVSLNSRLESKEEEEVAQQGTHAVCPAAHPAVPNVLAEGDCSMPCFTMGHIHCFCKKIGGAPIWSEVTGRSKELFALQRVGGLVRRSVEASARQTLISQNVFIN